jgi:hypothetical protein
MDATRSNVKKCHILRIAILCNVTDPIVAQIEALILTSNQAAHHSSSESLSIESHQRRFRGSCGVAGTDSGCGGHVESESSMW